MHHDFNAAPLAQAGFWRRAVAAWIDLCLVNALYLGFFAVGHLGLRLGLKSSGARFLSTELVTALILPYLVLWAALVAIYIAYFTRVGGQTPGKMLTGIRVVVESGDNPTWGQAMVRPLGYLLSGLPFGIGFLWAVIPPGKRAFHDLLTGTYVVRNRQEVSPARVGWARTGFFTIVCWSSVIGGGPLPASAALVERILATTNDHLITASDVSAYLTFFTPETEETVDAIHALIDRNLLLDEADRFAIGSPDEQTLSRRVEAVAKRMGGEQDLERALAGQGWSREDLRAWIAEDLRIAEFLDQRIYFFVIIPPEEITQYYETHREEYAALPPEEAREAITKRLTQERGDEKRLQFITKLRGTATIRINPPISPEG